MMDIYRLATVILETSPILIFGLFITWMAAGLIDEVRRRHEAL